MRSMKYLSIFVLVFGLAGCSLFSGSSGEKNTAPTQSIEQTLLPDISTPNHLKIPTMTQEKVTFQTTDGITIAGDWTLSKDAKKAVLLLHMMPAVRGSWSPLSAELNKNNFATLAIDLRGHGESTQQGEKKLDYTKFSDIEHQASRLDTDAALNFLKGKGFAEENISIVGASIGANLVADAMYRYSKINRGILLSPGLDYRGVRTEPAVKQLATPQKIWIVSSEGDKYSLDSTIKLQQIKPDNTTISIVEGSDHGTNMFASQKTLIQDIAKFLAS